MIQLIVQNEVCIPLQSHDKNDSISFSNGLTENLHLGTKLRSPIFIYSSELISKVDSPEYFYDKLFYLTLKNIWNKFVKSFDIR